MRFPQYEQYIGKSKDERREKVSASPALERKRFLLSRHPELKERLKKIHEIMKEEKAKYPELVALTLFGSLTKGYAIPESDIDGYILIDEDKILPKKPEEIDSPSVFSHIHDRIKEELKLNAEQKKNLTAYIFSGKRLPKLLTYTHDTTIDIMKADQLMRFFHLSIGTGINDYRKIILDTLESMGKDGEKIWKNIFSHLFHFENGGLDTKLYAKRLALYPKTIQEAKKYFLHENSDL
ncbi:MAG: nucleotidyltransferase domain-containing protein [Candidatus Sungbacteria bacterium]|nr:nucleotidyltransferase domain-containing protein [Candidatus Sungbacteria bacterium]